MDYIYFVSYAISNNLGQSGFGNASAHSSVLITSIEHTKKIQEDLKKMVGAEVIILNFQFLRTEE